jgi:hypothetical protein
MKLSADHRDILDLVYYHENSVEDCAVVVTRGNVHADLTVDGHRETWPVRSIRLRSWLRRKRYEATGPFAIE